MSESPYIPVKVLATGKLTLRTTELDCAVVDTGDGKPIRVLSSKKFQAALGRVTRTSPPEGIVQKESCTGNDEKDYIALLPPFLALRTLAPFITEETIVHCQRYGFKHAMGFPVYAYNAHLLPEVCEVYLTARDAGALLPNQAHIAEQCDKLMRAFARLGIQALVDEATGYQEHRSKDALQRMIDEYLGQNASAWLLTFVPEYYQEAYRLHGLRYDPAKYGTRRPSIIGQFTNQVIYSLILPAPVHAALKVRNPLRRSGTRALRHHQWLNTERGKTDLQAQLKTVLWLMRGASTLTQFWQRLEAGMPRSQMAWAFYDEDVPSPTTEAAG